MRPNWGKRYGEVIRKGGVLICLAFPIGEPFPRRRALIFGPFNSPDCFVFQTETVKAARLSLSRKKPTTPLSPILSE